MQTTPEQCQFIAFLLRLINAKNVLELGTFTGYCTLWMALHIPDDGKIFTCDLNEKWPSIGKKFWAEAGVSQKIEFFCEPANVLLDRMLKTKRDCFDFVFIDADKEGYYEYYEKAQQLLSPKGIIGIDNVLWEGKVIDEENNSLGVQTLRKLNKLILEDEEVFLTSLPIGDGLTLISKKRQML
jgi:caffeoyl-CoA O-methyltransferase